MVPQPDKPEPKPADKPEPKVVLREKRPEFKEKAIITKAPDRKSVETPDESFTVNFITEAPNTKQSFPVTHRDLIADDDLSSPGSSDDEEDPKRESFTAPGYDRLNKKNFEDFGDDVKDLESQMKATEKEWAGDRQSLSESIRSRDSLRSGRGEEVDGTAKSERVTPLSSPEHKSKEDTKELESKQARPLSGKISLFDRKREDTDVLKMARRFQSPPPVSSKTSPSSTKVEEKKPGSQQGGKLSERLKMFGGGAKTPPAKKPEKKEEKEEESARELTHEGSKSDSEEAGASDPAPVESTQDSSDASASSSAHVSPQTASAVSPKKRSSSYASMSAFETIEEEGSSGIDESVESLDKITPLPNIEHSLSRRHSAELLRLDGIVKPDLSAVTQTLAVTRKSSSSSPSQSPLLSSTRKAMSLHSTKTSNSELTKTEYTPPPVKSTSVPQVSSQGSEAMALFMNSANLPHLNSLLNEHKEKEKKRVAKAVSGLLAMPRWKGVSVQLKFRGLKTDDRAKIQIWKQHVSKLRTYIQPF